MTKKPKSIKAQVADQRDLNAQRYNAFKIVDELHRENFTRVLVEDFKMDDMQYARVLVPLRGGGELRDEDFVAFHEIAKNHGAKLSMQGGCVIIWPEKV